MEQKHLDAKGNGEVNYDYKNDTLFFKIKDREYKKSLDFEDVVIDIDKDDYIVGIQIFDASKLFRVDKETLRNVRAWEFNAKVENNIITFNLLFEMLKRNKIIVEKGQNIIRESSYPLKDAEIECKATA